MYIVSTKQVRLVSRERVQQPTFFYCAYKEWLALSYSKHVSRFYLTETGHVWQVKVTPRPAKHDKNECKTIRKWYEFPPMHYLSYFWKKIMRWTLRWKITVETLNFLLFTFGLILPNQPIAQSMLHLLNLNIAANCENINWYILIDWLIDIIETFLKDAFK